MSTKSIRTPLVCQLSRADAPDMLAHLLALNEHDREQRFGSHLSDVSVARYVELLDFDRDAHYGVWQQWEGEDLLVGLLHLGVDPAFQQAEVGISVDERFRRRGVANRLLERGILHARNLGVAEVMMYFLPYNTGILELARQAGMKVSIGGGEGVARMPAQPPTMLSLARELVSIVSDLPVRLWALRWR